MPKALVFKLLLSLTTLGAAPAADPLGRDDPADVVPSIVSDKELERLPFLIEPSFRMTVPIVVQGGRTLDFLIDTGAERSAVSREIASSLRWPQTGSMPIVTFTGVHVVPTVRIPELRISKTVRTNVDALMFAHRVIGADGFLGLDTLADKRVEFDFVKDRMSFRSASRAGFFKDGESVIVHANRRQGRLVFSNARVNRVPADVLLDTGSSITIGNAALRDRLRATGRLNVTVPVRMMVISGEIIRADYGMVDEVMLRGVRIRRMPIAFATVQPFRALGLEDRPALLLGMDALRSFGEVSVDFRNRSVRFVAREDNQPSATLHYFGS